MKEIKKFIKETDNSILFWAMILILARALFYYCFWLVYPDFFVLCIIHTAISTISVVHIMENPTDPNIEKIIFLQFIVLTLFSAISIMIKPIIYKTYLFFKIINVYLLYDKEMKDHVKNDGDFSFDKSYEFFKQKYKLWNHIN